MMRSKRAKRQQRNKKRQQQIKSVKSKTTEVSPAATNENANPQFARSANNADSVQKIATSNVSAELRSPCGRARYEPLVETMHPVMTLITPAKNSTMQPVTTALLAERRAQRDGALATSNHSVLTTPMPAHVSPAGNYTARVGMRAAAETKTDAPVKQTDEEEKKGPANGHYATEEVTEVDVEVVKSTATTTAAAAVVTATAAAVVVTANTASVVRQRTSNLCIDTNAANAAAVNNSAVAPQLSPIDSITKVPVMPSSATSTPPSLLTQELSGTSFDAHVAAAAADDDDDDAASTVVDTTSPISHAGSVAIDTASLTSAVASVNVISEKETTASPSKRSPTVASSSSSSSSVRSPFFSAKRWRRILRVTKRMRLLNPHMPPLPPKRQ
jgi:hypothetical protein